MTKIAGSGSESISQRHKSSDPDLDPHHNVMDPQHWLDHGDILTINVWYLLFIWRVSDEEVSHKIHKKCY
jgi:hypothetical protein